MAKSANQKLKILYLLKILLEKTDDQHRLTMSEILRLLDGYGISAERKSIYDDFEALRLYGVDVQKSEEKPVGYFVGERDFELPELKLLVDAVQSSRFITQQKTLSLIKKLETLTSAPNARRLHRQVYVFNRVKTMNSSVYYNIDGISEAISEDRSITFLYYEWNEKKEKVFRHGGELYRVSPYALVWDDEKYYLIAYDEKNLQLRHYRVDKMSGIRDTGDRRIGQETFLKIDLAQYSNTVFGMFGGNRQTVRLLCDNSLSGVIVDRFGLDLPFTRRDDGEFEISVEVAVSPMFLSWVIGFAGKMAILSPENVRQELLELALETMKSYENPDNI